MVLQLVPSCLSICQQPTYSFGPPENKAFENRRLVIRSGITKPQIFSSSIEAITAVGLRVFVISDIHTDYSENITWVKDISVVKHKKDVLLVAGDVAETYDNFVLTMSLLKDRFEHVFYVPGNHDLWCRREKDNYMDSLEKLDKLIDACKIVGVETSPMIIDALGIIPLFSWYHESFDKEEEITSIRIPPLEMACKDFHACKWPQEFSNEDTSLAVYFDVMNNTHQETVMEIQRCCNQIISFSHFLPRYVQAPLAYPRERKRRMNGGENWLPFCIYSDGQLADKLYPCYWSDYYSANPRAPHNTKLAPWVARFYRNHHK